MNYLQGFTRCFSNNIEIGQSSQSFLMSNKENTKLMKKNTLPKFDRNPF